MELIISLLIAGFFGTGVYCLFQRSFIKLIAGLILIGQGANLLVFSVGGLMSLKPAFVGKEAPPMVADPLPQALVLTAIVISFGLIIFTISLLLKAQRELKSDDLNQLNTTDTL